MAPYEFTFKGEVISEAKHGSDYVAEFQQALGKFVPKPPRAVLEWGSGITSLVLLEQCQIWNSSLFLTIDHHPAYQHAVFAGRNLPQCLQIVCVDTVGASRSQSDAEPSYSSFPSTLGRQFDLVIIDGRRRVECAYAAALMIHEETIVILHDYRRARYQSVSRLYDVVQDGEQFRVMRPRPAMLKALGV